jgi:membrane-bound lytic murein transglycosylase B
MRSLKIPVDEAAGWAEPFEARHALIRSFGMMGGREFAAATFAAIAVVAIAVVAFAVVALAVLVCLGTRADAAQCGSGPAGFEAWTREFAEEARAKGIGASTVAALMQANYASATIAADRGQRSFGLSLDAFLAKRGASAIVARGRALKQSQAALFASIQQRYGVPPGPLLAIWGMETGFGSQRGNQNMLSSIATLAYDCRRPEFFTDQLYATLRLIDRGVLSPGTRGSMHGEVGQTQFMPKNILAYGTGNLDVAANALNSTANFLKAHGWRAGAGYQPGEPNFAAIEAWNAASVYQRAIALIGRQIDGGESGSAAR